MKRNKTCLYIRLPSIKSASTSNCPSFWSFLYGQVITHPLYSSTTLNNDIALLKLASPVVFTPRISPVCLAPSTINILPGTRCFTTGWGRTATTCKSAVRQRQIGKNYLSVLSNVFFSFFSASPPVLQQTGLPITSPAVCRQIWGQSKITDAMICAGASGSSSCQVYEDRSRQTHSHINFAAVSISNVCLCLCVSYRVILVVLWCVRVKGSGLWWGLCPGAPALVTLFTQ